jgi:hypothetical protein
MHVIQSILLTFVLTKIIRESLLGEIGNAILRKPTDRKSEVFYFCKEFL